MISLILNYSVILIAVIGGCLPCPNNCKSCQLLSKCNECNSGFHVNDNGTCEQCFSGCATCTAIYSWRCTSCDYGYYLLGNRICSQCRSPCLSCTSSSSCTSCNFGYYMYNGSCHQCSWPCLSCASSRCTSCASEYYIDSNGYCNKCSSQCVECTSSSNCYMCNYGYNLRNGYCYNYQCSTGCAECTSPSFCISCISDYYQKNGKCAACDATCLTCSSVTGDCTSCPEMFYLTKGSCLSCGDNCLSCNGTTGTCDECKKGYYGDKCQRLCDKQCNGKLCEHISGRCINGCKVGYYQSENKCASCPTNCTICHNSFICTNCTQGHYLNTFEDGSVVCFLCDEACSTCELSQCINNETHNHSSNKYTKETDSTAIKAGAIGGTCFVVMVVGIAVAVVYIHRRYHTPQPRNRAMESQEDPIPIVHYVNTSNLNDLNESKRYGGHSHIHNHEIFPQPAGEPTTYESLSKGNGDKDNYSSLN